MIARSHAGKVITFYSYKGGTGRTMALANVAVQMAQQQDRIGKVLMIDWDIESPGLDRYFSSWATRRFPDSVTRDHELGQFPGLIELFLELNTLTLSDEWRGKENSEDAAQELVDGLRLDAHVFETDVDSLYLMKAGRFDSQYADKVNTFDWESLYRRSPWLFRAFAERLASEYTYVLIDSRTGLTDISGICTMLMPDMLVAVFTPNRQSLIGVLEQIRNATEYRIDSDDLRSLNVFPLPSRIEAAEPTLRDDWRLGKPEEDIVGFQPQFEELFKEVYDLADISLQTYFDEVQIQHVPRYSYGEVIAVLAERGQDRLSLTRSYRDFTQRLVNSSNPWEGTRGKQTVGATYWLGRPATIGEGFVGRDLEIAMIGKAFEDNQVVAISGGAGSGKSRLAAEYTYRSAMQGFWTAAGNDDVLTLVGLASALGIDVGNHSDDEVAAEVRISMANMPSDTLWVIDNVERLEQVNSLLNAVNIRILITTRDDRSQVLQSTTVAFLQLPTFDLEPSIVLLNSRSESEPSDPALSKIAEIVGYLPMALEMLAVRLGEFGQTPGTLLDQLGRVPTPIQLSRFLEARGTTIDRIEGVFNTITGTLENLSADSRELISPLGYIDDAPIPKRFLSIIVGVDDERLGTVVEEARQYSVISIVDSEAVVPALTIGAIAATNSEGALETTLNRGLDRLVGINRNDPVVLRAEITHHERILSESRKVLNSEHPEIVAYASNLAIGYGDLGRYAEAVELYDEVLRIRERLLGLEHPDTLESRSDLALGYRDLGRYQEAFELDEETLRIRERLRGPEHLDTLESRSNLALGYRDIKRYQEAFELDEETLRIKEKLLGPEHPDTLRTRNNLASGYGALERYEESIQFFDETRSIMERVLGPEHPDTLQSRSNLAIAYHALDRNQEAIRLDEETLRIRERVLGPEHPDTLQSRNNLASGYGELGRKEEAIQLAEETLRIREKVLGPEHPDTLESRSNLDELVKDS